MTRDIDMSEPLDTIVAGLVRETRESDWETRFEFFAAGAQAVVEFGQSVPANEYAVEDLPTVAALAAAVVRAFGVVPVIDKYQTAIYFLSRNAMHKAMSVADSDEAGRVFRLKPATLFRWEAGRRCDRRRPGATSSRRVVLCDLT
jgi:hypothetical protein